MGRVVVGAGTVLVRREWSEFVKLLDGTEKTIQVQSEYLAPQRTVFAIDGTIVYQTIIYDAGFEPSGWTAQQIVDNTDARDAYTNTWAAQANAPTAATANAAAHYNGTATTTPTTLTFPKPTRGLFIQNVGNSAAADLWVSFDGGANYKTLRRLDTLSLNISLTSMVVRSSSGSIPYEAIVTL